MGRLSWGGVTEHPMQRPHEVDSGKAECCVELGKQEAWHKEEHWRRGMGDRTEAGAPWEWFHAQGLRSREPGVMRAVSRLSRWSGVQGGGREEAKVKDPGSLPRAEQEPVFSLVELWIHSRHALSILGGSL